MENNKRRFGKIIVLIVGCLVVCVAFLAILLKDTPQEAEEKAIQVRAYTAGASEYVLENDQLKFVMDAETTQFTITKKSTGYVWYSNPQGIDEDTVALKEDKNNLNSTALITYSTENGVNTLFNNFSYSINRDIYEIESGEDYVKVLYSLGNRSKTFVIPNALPSSRMVVFLDKMDTADRKQVENYYRKYTINKLKATDDKDALLKAYPDLVNEPYYVLRDGLQDHIKDKLVKAFENAEYTYDDYLSDMELYGAAEEKDSAVFNISMVYRLDGEDLIVEVPMNEIEYPEKYKLTKINLLPYMGAGSMQDDGFLFVPEGGGAIIHFNNGKLEQNPYYANMYGWDYSISRREVVHETEIEFPVYGVSNNDASYICILENGASYASISADISGRYNSFNSVSATFTTLHSEAYDVSEKSNVPVYIYEKQVPNEVITERFRFVDSNNYVAMAKSYQEYLLNTNPMMKRKEDTSVPVAVEILGAVDKVQHKLGMPVSEPLKLTSFTESKQLIEDLKAGGYQNLSVKLSGWANGGINQSVLNKVNLVSELGSKKSFEQLLQYTKDSQVPVYLDGVTQFAYDSKASDGFFAFRDAARFASQEKVVLHYFDPIYFAPQTWTDTFYVLTPSMAKKMCDNLINAASNYGAAGVSFRDLGDNLSADYNKKDLVTREAHAKLQQQSLQNTIDAGQSVMINRGNSYAIGYADFVTNMDLEGSKYQIIDETIPFYQIALHGYVNYTDVALNLSADLQTLVLKSAESGASLYFTFMKESATTLQNTLYSQYYGADYDAFKDIALGIYKEFNEKLGRTYKQTIVNHYKLNENVTATVYEDGSTVLVNYGYTDFEVNGTIVPARNYILEGGK